jgi:PKD repeat protein
VLTVTDANSVKATATHVAIVVHGPLAATSSVSPTVGDASFAATFSGTPSGGTAPYTFAWSFGDGSTSTSQNPSHTYAAAGTYSAHLTITDAAGGAANATALTITVNPPPTATASAGALAGDAPAAVTFTGGASSGTAPYTYSWAFGDGGTSASRNPSHTYTAAGTYDAVLTITDAAGRNASAPAITMTISPALSATALAAPSSGSSPLAVTLTATPSGGATPYTYAWALGDGATSALPNLSHSYSAGTYTAQVTITDANGVTARATSSAIISIGPLVAGANATPAVGDAPLPTKLAGSATGGKAPLAYSWDFGDGTTGTQQSPSHTYSVAGTYTATETISDSSGQVAHATAAITVYPGLTVSVSVTPTSGAAPLGVSFAVTVSGGLPPYTLDWDYGDGVAGSGVSATHTYAGGTFHPKLTLHDYAGGGWSQGVGTITSTGAAPVNPPAAVNPPAGGGSQASPPADATPAASPSASATTTSPSPSPTTAARAPSTPANPGGANPVLLLLGGVLATGLGGAVFVGWLRRRGV